MVVEEQFEEVGIACDEVDWGHASVCKDVWIRAFVEKSFAEWLGIFLGGEVEELLPARGYVYVFDVLDGGLKCIKIVLGDSLRGSLHVSGTVTQNTLIFRPGKF